jgi:hypothetical protein
MCALAKQSPSISYVILRQKISRAAAKNESRLLLTYRYAAFVDGTRGRTAFPVHAGSCSGIL